MKERGNENHIRQNRPDSRCRSRYRRIRLIQYRRRNRSTGLHSTSRRKRHYQRKLEQYLPVRKHSTGRLQLSKWDTIRPLLHIHAELACRRNDGTEINYGHIYVLDARHWLEGQD